MPCATFESRGIRCFGGTKAAFRLVQRPAAARLAAAAGFRHHAAPRDKIGFWEVVNEPTLHREPKIDEPYRWVREANPEAYLIVNEAYVLADGRPIFWQLLDKAVKSGVPFDGIGIQAHEPKGMRFPLDRVRIILDGYAARQGTAHHRIHADFRRRGNHRLA